jgi:uncharacterized protein YdeI (YjbR/CyaY-like superfamily)
MQPAGLAAFARRQDDRSAIYSYEQRKTAELDRTQQARFRRHRAAWAFFRAQPPSYRRLAAHYVISAKRPETRARRLETLIAKSATKQRL